MYLRIATNAEMMSESDLMTRVCRGVVEKEREGEMAWEVEGESRELGESAGVLAAFFEQSR